MTFPGLSVAKPPQAPALFAWTTPRGVPLPALLLTSSVSALCFGSSFIGSGEVRALSNSKHHAEFVSFGVGSKTSSACRTRFFFLQIPGCLISSPSAQIAWLSIGLASWRFRKAWIRQGRALSDLKFHTSWTWPYGPPFVVNIVLTMASGEANLISDRLSLSRLSLSVRRLPGVELLR